MIKPLEEGDAAMELTLRYSGLLTSNGDKNEKHRIRKELHPQIETLWKRDTRLSDKYSDLLDLQTPSLAGNKFEVPRPLKRNKDFWWRHPLNGWNFIPLFTRIHEAHCELSVRIYRKTESRGVLFEGGDIDNRLKTFLDALTVPMRPDQSPNEAASENPNDWPPLMCLMDDDRSVTKLTVQSIRMLTEPPPSVRDTTNYVELDVDVIITPVLPLMGTMELMHP